MVWDLKPVYAGVLQMISYAILTFFIISRLYIKKRTNSAIARTVILLTIILAALIIFIF
jgi:hypothetical protein